MGCLVNLLVGYAVVLVVVTSNPHYSTVTNIRSQMVWVGVTETTLYTTVTSTVPASTTHVTPTKTHVTPTKTHVTPTKTHVTPTKPHVTPTKASAPLEERTTVPELIHPGNPSPQPIICYKGWCFDPENHDEYVCCESISEPFEDPQPRQLRCPAETRNRGICYQRIRPDDCGQQYRNTGDSPVCKKSNSMCCWDACLQYDVCSSGELG